MATIGIDPVEAFIRAAHRRDPAGEYRLGRAEELPFADASFDLVVSYLSLVDIEDLAAAVSEMVRVLAPSGRLLIANLASHNTAGRWIEDGQGRTSGYLIDDYLKQHPVRQRWAGIDIVNWHRPLSFYMRHFLAMGLMLTHFDEPAPEPGVDRTDGRFARAPWFVVMEWQKP
jgi:SAM-dependent methyltransferase